ncbi:MAG: DUF4340 domain-containing protein [Ignavibacteriales bacterium]|nr:DUF4340 domain-containing protein [Ignavibacteriales bacterium]
MNKTTQILIAVLVILVVIVILILPSSGEREVSYDLPLAAVKIDSGAVVKIEIVQPKSSIMLENIGGKWEVTSPIHATADPVAIAQLLNGFSQFKIGSLISSNPEKQKLFQVDSSGTRLTFTNRNAKTTSLIIGKMGPSFSELYFRLPDSKEVYLGEGVDTWNVNKSVKDWRDKSIYRTMTESIKEITITTAAKEFLFNRESDGWHIGDRVIDNNELNPLLNTLSNLRADDFVDTVTDINSKPIIVSVNGADKISLSFYPVLPDSGKYFVRSARSPQLFIVNKWIVQQILQPTVKPIAGVKPSLETEIAVDKTPIKKEEVKSAEVSNPVIEKPKPVLAPAKQNIEASKETPKQVEKQIAPVTKEKESKPIVEPKKETPKAQVAAPKQELELKKQFEQPKTQQPPESDEEGELIVHTVAKGESMTTIAKKYSVTPEKIIKWNLLKSIAVKPGQELYIYVKK